MEIILMMLVTALLQNVKMTTGPSKQFKTITKNKVLVSIEISVRTEIVRAPLLGVCHAKYDSCITVDYTDFVPH